MSSHGKTNLAVIVVSVLMVVSVLIVGLAVGFFRLPASIGAIGEIGTIGPQERSPPASARGSVASVLGVESANPPKKKFPVTIRKPAGPPQVDTGVKDVHGQPITVSCNTCHANRKANFANKTAADLNEFHAGLNMAHGSVSCLSCHNSTDYDALKLADNTRVEYSEVMTLCAQCHGSQMKDFEHGVHGGMNGFWDRSRGPQTKNNCIDCHNPHAPQFPKMRPTFKPRDRFLEKVEDY